MPTVTITRSQLELIVRALGDHADLHQSRGEAGKADDAQALAAAIREQGAAQESQDAPEGGEA